jgi:2-keto-4-pentenoate hydratase/2-oxohepta-3-ene-1,7-dioic acid hydratase in catechol pathway
MARAIRVRRSLRAYEGRARDLGEVDGRALPAGPVQPGLRQDMKIARVAQENETRVAIVVGDTAHVLDPSVSILELLAADPPGRERLATRVERQRFLGDVRLLAPIEPPTIRDFSVFEQHIEGVLMDADPQAVVPEVWYESPFCYFSNPHAVTGPGDEIAIPPGCHRLDLELEVGAVIGRAGTNLSREEAGTRIAGYTIFNDWSARDLQMAEMRLGLGVCKGKDFANASARGS